MCAICPNCKEKTFLYNSKEKAHFCINGLCKWTDKITPASDVPMWFLEYCLEHAKSKPHKLVMKKIIQATIKIKETVSNGSGFEITRVSRNYQSQPFNNARNAFNVMSKTSV